jgi:hypothetical protein
VAFKTSAWFQVDELDDTPAPPELLPGFDREAATARGKLEREQVKFRLYGEGANDLGNTLANCGLPLPLVCVCCGNDRAVETSCRKRWCPACQWQIQRKRIDRFSGAVSLMKWPAFLTLTQTNDPDPEKIRDLRQAWSRMRRRKIFVDKILGGVAAIEVTNHGNGWHPHLHAIIDCEWLSVHTPAPTWRDSHDVFVQKCEHAQNELSSVWAGVLGQPEAIVWVTRMKDLDRLRYSLKYACKGSDLVKSPDPIAPLIRVLDRSRLVSAFGNLHGRTSEMELDEHPVHCCQLCGNEKSFLPLDVVQRMARVEPDRILPTVGVRQR